LYFFASCLRLPFKLIIKVPSKTFYGFMFRQCPQSNLLAKHLCGPNLFICNTKSNQIIGTSSRNFPIALRESPIE